MPSSATTFLTAVLAVACAAVMALLLADHGAPRERHTVVKPAQVVVEAPQLDAAPCPARPVSASCSAG